MQQQPYTQQNQQTTMSQPPDILTTKDLAYIDDMLSWNLLAMKKAHFAAMHCQDATIKAAFDKCGQMHQNHYNKILNHLQDHLQTQPSSQNQQMM
ncbi:hypothetical protein ACQKCU_06325 [Heyndrickxia sporothermodurans]